MVILAAVKYVGGANAVLPVITEAIRDKQGHVVFADPSGPVASSFALRYPQYLDIVELKEDPIHLLQRVKPDVVLISTICFHEANKNLELIREAAHQGSKIVVVQDFWGNHVLIKEDMLPDIICVQDQFGKKLVLDTWKNYPAEKVLPTGQPAFDYLAKVNCQEAKAELRQKFELRENWPIIHFSGGVDGMPEAVAMTIEALNNTDRPVYFFMRHHPVLLSPNSNKHQKKIYEAYKDLSKQLKNGLAVESQSQVTSNLVNTASDIVVSQYGTMLIEACYLGKPSIAIWTNTTADDFRKSTNLNDFPPYSLGAASQVTNPEQLTSVLDSAFRQDNRFDAIKQNQFYNFKSDGQSAKRIYGVIKELI